MRQWGVNALWSYSQKVRASGHRHWVPLQGGVCVKNANVKPQACIASTSSSWRIFVIFLFFFRSGK